MRDGSKLFTAVYNPKRRQWKEDLPDANGPVSLLRGTLRGGSLPRQTWPQWGVCLRRLHFCDAGRTGVALMSEGGVL